MRRILALLTFFPFLISCSRRNDAIDLLISLRESLLSGNGCTFDSCVNAEFGDDVYVFKMNCSADKFGNLSFTVTEPETIAGISGKIISEEGTLHFDDKVLIFDLLADGTISPVSIPWLFLKTLLSGYINSGGKFGEMYLLEVDDSYKENSLRLDILLSADGMPKGADIVYSGMRVASIVVDNFTIL